MTAKCSLPRWEGGGVACVNISYLTLNYLNTALHCLTPRYSCICSAQSGNLHNLEIALVISMPNIQCM